LNSTSKITDAPSSKGSSSGSQLFSLTVYKFHVFKL
jgi:hypothetical protein